MSLSRLKMDKSKLLMLFILVILGVILIFFFLSCGKGPQKKVQDPNLGQYANDFSYSFNDTTPARGCWDENSKFWRCAIPDSDNADEIQRCLNEGWSVQNYTKAIEEVGFVSLTQSGRTDEKSLADTELTIEAWLKRKTNPADLSGTIFTRAHGLAGISLFVKNNSPRFSIKKTSVSTAYITDSGYILKNDEWTHVGGVLVNQDHNGVHFPCDLSNLGSHTSIAKDSSGNLHISYYDVTNESIKYATNKNVTPGSGNCFTGSNWDCVTVESGTALGKFSSIAVDPNDDSIHISYHDDGDGGSFDWDFKYATNKGVTPGNGNCNGGSPANFSCATFTSGNRGRYSSIAVDSSSVVHVSYFYTYNALDDADLIYTRCASSCTDTNNWTTTTVEADTTWGSGGDGVGWFTSIAVKGNDIHISYLDYINDELKYATCSSSCTNSGNWTKTTVDDSIGSLDNSNKSGLNTSLDVDISGNLHISYYDADTGDLNYATNSGVTSGSGNCFTGSDFDCLAVDSTGNVGQFSSIAVDSPGDGENPHITYYDATNGDLKYATCSTVPCTSQAKWTTSTVDSGSDVGQYSSIVIVTDPIGSDDVHISYYENSEVGDLKHAAKGSWTTEAVDQGSSDNGETESPHMDIYVNGEYRNCVSTDEKYSDDLVTVTKTADVYNCETGEWKYGSSDPFDEDVNEQMGKSAGGSKVDLSEDIKLNAVIDEVRFWKVARAGIIKGIEYNYIQQCMKQELSITGGTCGIDDATILIGYWKFNEGVDVNVFDHSGSGNSGTKNYCDFECDSLGATTLSWDNGWVAGYPFP